MDVELLENGGNNTIGRISSNSRKISLGFIPQGSRFESFSTDPIATFSYQDVTKGDEDCYNANCSGNDINASEEFISSIRMQASTSGDDVGSGECSDVPGDAYIKIKFNPIQVNISRN